jgi:hypothetical protein
MDIALNIRANQKSLIPPSGGGWGKLARFNVERNILFYILPFCLAQTRCLASPLLDLKSITSKSERSGRRRQRKE